MEKFDEITDECRRFVQARTTREEADSKFSDDQCADMFEALERIVFEKFGVSLWDYLAECRQRGIFGVLDGVMGGPGRS